MDLLCEMLTYLLKTMVKHIPFDNLLDVIYNIIIHSELFLYISLINFN